MPRARVESGWAGRLLATTVSGREDMGKRGDMEDMGNGPDVRNAAYVETRTLKKAAASPAGPRSCWKGWSHRGLVGSDS